MAGESNGEQARLAILHLIREELRPGDKLVIRPLAQRLGMSATPVRQALLQLAQEGFVEYVPGGGAHVRRVDWRELMDTIEVRAALEELLARRFVVRASELDFLMLEKLAQAAAEAYQRRDLAAHERIAPLSLEGAGFAN